MHVTYLEEAHIVTYERTYMSHLKKTTYVCHIRKKKDPHVCHI